MADDNKGRSGINPDNKGGSGNNPKYEGENQTLKPIKKNNLSGLEKFTYYFLIPAILVTILGLIIYYIVALEDSKKIMVQNSNKPAGEFAVEPAVTASSSSVLQLCTINGKPNSACNYSVNSVSEAINICNQNSNICNRFIYNNIQGATQSSMSIIGLNDNVFTESQTSSIYTRQNGVTYITSGSQTGTQPSNYNSNVSLTQPISTTSTTPTTSALSGIQNPAVSS